MTVAPRRTILCVFLFASPAEAQPKPSPAQVEFFEKKVRPVLAQHCLSCHGEAGKKVKGGLRMTARAELLTGGDTGPSLVPGDAAKSLLVQAVKYDGDLKMPPKGRLKDHEIADLTAWVKDGAAWPEMGSTAATAKAGGPLFTDAQRGFWAFQPVRKPAVPQSTLPHPIDAFLAAKREAAGLRPAPPADPRTLIRRVTFDLTGLPPTPAEVDAFLADTSADAFEKVIDRLLASPAYGERWARHWLDVVRYADSNGLDENTSFGNAWRYRDYVIRAFNDDKPYDQFVKEQLAGDLLGKDEGGRMNDESKTRNSGGFFSSFILHPSSFQDALTATGFLVLGPKVLAEPDKQKMVMDIVDEQIDVVSKAMLGLTISCARCHDHKFDPLPTRDYYSLAGIFKSTKTMATLATVAKAHERTLASPADEAKLKAHQANVDALDGVAKKAKTPPFAALGGTAGAQAATITLNKSVAALKAAAPPVPMVLAVQDDAKPGDVKVHVRGNHLTLGETAPRIFPRIVAGEAQTPVPPTGSGRLQFAEWVASPANPLTARVIVNRVWMHHFGEGIVRSPDNFGKLGDRPTHPELLDWLANELANPDRKGGGNSAGHPLPYGRGSPEAWSLKRLHKLILTSDAYKMSTAFSEPAALADPDNKLLWRFNRRRLEAEAIRDGMLAAAGTLDRTTGGSLLNNGNFEYIQNEHSKGGVRYGGTRRSVYLPVIRNNVFEFFQTFDFVEPHVPNGKRSSTVVAPQALYLMNNPFVAEQAKAFAASLPKEDSERVKAAYLRALARPATADEVSRALRFVGAFKASAGDRAKAWAAWCQVLFASSEFAYLD